MAEEAVVAAPAPVAAPVAAPAAAPVAAPVAAEPVVDLFADPVDPPADGAPPADPAAETTTYDLKLPEGLELEGDAIAGVKDFFAQAKVPPELAQPLFEKYAADLKAASQSSVEAARTADQNAWTDMQKAWQAEIKADPEIGGAKLDQTIASTRKGAETLLGKEGAQALFTALNVTGAGNQPAIVKALFKSLSIHAPATSVSGNAPAAAAPKNAARTMYPNQGGTALGNASI